jgi:hypothetical protein
MDIDMLGRTNREEAFILRQVRDIIMMDVGMDGLSFDPDSLRTVNRHAIMTHLSQ